MLGVQCVETHVEAVAHELCVTPFVGAASSSHVLKQAHPEHEAPGHACGLHALSVSVSAGHTLPPFATGVPTDRVRVLAPPAHVTEHDPHVAHSSTTQLIGQASVLQASDSSVSAGHTVPAPTEGVCTVRVCFRVPPPHDLSHGSQSLQADITQSTGHVAPQ